MEAHHNRAPSSLDERLQLAKRSRLASDILSQPESLVRVLQQQYGAGLSSLMRAATLLHAAGRAVITGMGASMFAAIPLQYELSSQGIDAILLEAGEFLHYGLEAYRDAAVIMVSRSGDSIEIAKLLAILKGRQPIIGVSNEPNGRLSREADESILVGSLADEMVAIQTYTGTLLTLFLLGRALRGTLEQTRAEMEGVIEQFASLVTGSLERMGEWVGFLENGSPPYLLGRGPSLASVHEGSLLFHEVAKSAAVALPAATFRHGPVEVADAAFRGIVFAPQGRTRELNIALAQDLLRFGGAVRVLGPPHQAFTPAQSYSIPACPEALAPLFEIVPVQAAALALAAMKSIVPGSFRYAPQVATDEARFSPG